MKKQSQNFTLLAVLFATYMALTTFYWGLDYLNNIDGRMRGIDGRYYYMYIRSLFFDHDVDFTNEVSHFFGSHRVDETRTVTGMVGNHYSIGPSLFWAPFFLLAHVTTLAANALGGELPVDGYSSFYAASVYVGNSLSGILGFIFLAAALQRFFDFRSTLLVCLATLLASPLTYYLWSFTAMSHNVSFFAATLFLWVFLRTGVSISTSICIGLMFLARWQDVLYAIPVVLLAVRNAIQALSRRDFHPLPWLLRHLGLAGAFFLTVFPQLIVWKIIYGQWITIPSTAQEIDLSDLHPLQVLFGMNNGLLSWHPLLALGVIGLILLGRKDRFIALGFGIALLVQFIFVSSLQRSAGWAFGSRFLIGSLPFLAFGMAALFEMIGRYQVGLFAAPLFVLVFSVWNQLFVYQYQRGLIPRGTPLTMQQLIGEKFRICEVAESERLYRLGKNHLLKDVNRSLELARQADALAPNREKVVFLKAISAFFAGEFQESGRSFERLAMLDPKESLYKLGLAYYYLSAGDPEKAHAVVDGLNDLGADWIRQFRSPGMLRVEPAFSRRIFKKLFSFDGI